MSAMNTPPSRLFSAASAISSQRPGTSWIASTAARTSILEAPSSAGVGLGLGEADRSEGGPARRW